MATTKKKLTFEQQLAQVETLIEQMENGGLTLDDSLKSYEEGAKLLASMEKELANATQRLTVIRKQSSGEEVEEPLEVDS